MAKRGRAENENFELLEEFECKAIPPAELSKAHKRRRKDKPQPKKERQRLSSSKRQVAEEAFWPMQSEESNLIMYVGGQSKGAGSVAIPIEVIVDNLKDRLAKAPQGAEPFTALKLAAIYANLLGDRSAAIQLLQEQVELAKAANSPPWTLAILYLNLATYLGAGGESVSFTGQHFPGMLQPFGLVPDYPFRRGLTPHLYLRTPFWFDEYVPRPTNR